MQSDRAWTNPISPQSPEREELPTRRALEFSPHVSAQAHARKEGGREESDGIASARSLPQASSTMTDAKHAMMSMQPELRNHYRRCFALQCLASDAKSVDAMPLQRLERMVPRLRLPARANVGKNRLRALLRAQVQEQLDVAGGRGMEAKAEAGRVAGTNASGLGFEAFVGTMAALARASFGAESRSLNNGAANSASVNGTPSSAAAAATADQMSRLLREHLLPHVSGTESLPRGLTAAAATHFARNSSVVGLLGDASAGAMGTGRFCQPLLGLFRALTATTSLPASQNATSVLGGAAASTQTMSYALFRRFCDGFFGFSRDADPALTRGDLGRAFVFAATQTASETGGSLGSELGLGPASFLLVLKVIAACARGGPALSTATEPDEAVKWLLLRIRESPLQQKHQVSALAGFNAAFDAMWAADGRQRYGGSSAVNGGRPPTHVGPGQGAGIDMHHRATPASMQAPAPPHSQPLARHPLAPNESVPGLSVLTNTHAAPMSVAVSLNRLRERGQTTHGHSQVPARRPSLERLAKGQLAEQLRQQQNSSKLQQQSMSRLATPRGGGRAAQQHVILQALLQQERDRREAEARRSRRSRRVKAVPRGLPSPRLQAPAPPVQEKGVVAPSRQDGKTPVAAVLQRQAEVVHQKVSAQPDVLISSPQDVVSGSGRSGETSTGSSANPDGSSSSSSNSSVDTDSSSDGESEMAAHAWSKASASAMQHQSQRTLLDQAQKYIALWCQSRWRMVMAKRFALRKRNARKRLAAAVLLQSCARSFLQRSQLRSAHAVVRRMQASFRGHRTRKYGQIAPGFLPTPLSRQRGPHLKHRSHTIGVAQAKQLHSSDSSRVRETLWPDKHQGGGLVDRIRVLFNKALFADAKGDADCELLANYLRRDREVKKLLEIARARRVRVANASTSAFRYPQLDRVCAKLEEQENEGVTWGTVVQLLKGAGLITDDAVREQLQAFAEQDELARRKYSLANFEQAQGTQTQRSSPWIKVQGGAERRPSDAHSEVASDADSNAPSEGRYSPVVIDMNDSSDDDDYIEESNDFDTETISDKRDNHWVASAMGYDIAMVFPHHRPGKPNKKCSLKTFQKKLLGLYYDGDGVTPHIDAHHGVLKSCRCMLSDDVKHNMYLRNILGEHDMASGSINSVLQRGGKRERLLKEFEFVLRSEWVRHFTESCNDSVAAGSSSPIPSRSGRVSATTESIVSQRQFDELIAKAITQRLQVACGLQAEMYYSIDDDEIICTIMADENDLRTEAARVKYSLQVRLQPFSAKHKAEDSNWREMHKDAYIKSIHHLSRTCDTFNPVTPEMDPILFKARTNTHEAQDSTSYRNRFDQEPEHFVHRKLVEELSSWGHNPAIDWDDVSVASLLRKDEPRCCSRLALWVKEVMHVSTGPHNYFAPYAEYKVEHKYQPYFRHYVARAPPHVIAHQMRKFNQSNFSMRGKNGTQYTLFRDIDRIRLTSSIVTRHLNIDAMVQSHLTKKGIYSLHSVQILHRLKHSWALHFRWKELWGANRLPLLEIRDYFGEKIAMYFAFLDFMTKMLTVPMVFGIITTILTLIPLPDIPFGKFQEIVVNAKDAGRTFVTGKDDEGPPTKDFSKTVSVQSCFLVLFALSLSVWATLFTSLWKRKTALLNLWWGMTELHNVEIPRPEFNGVVRLNPVTNLSEPWYESQAKKKWTQAKNYVFVAALLTGCVYLVYYCMVFKNYAMVNYGKYGTIFSGAVMAGQISTFNYLYKVLAIKLTKWENHRTESEHQANMISKAFIFQFVNSYGSAIYIAFLKKHLDFLPLRSELFTKNYTNWNCSWNGYTNYVRDEMGVNVESSENFKKYRQKTFNPAIPWDINKECRGCVISKETGAPDCLDELQMTLFIVLLGRMFGNIPEIASPFFKKKLNVWLERKQLDEPKRDKRNGRKAHVHDSEKYEQAEYEAKLKPYGELEFFDDYNEIVLLYGYVVLFAAAFPLAPLIAFMMNVIEVHVDAYKLTVYGRPKPLYAADIGMWAYFLGVMSTASVITNMGLIIYSSPFFADWSDWQKLLLFVIVENTMLVLKRTVEYAVPDVPQKVRSIDQRYDLIGRKVFKGFTFTEEHKGSEVEETVDLEIRQNPVKLARQQMEKASSHAVESRPRRDADQRGTRNVARGKSYVQI